MRFLSIIPALLLCIFAGCTCCPNYYGPGLTPQPYGSCVGTQTIAPPMHLKASRRSHRPTLAEHKQARDLRRWYKELNSEPRNRRARRATGYDDYYDESAFYDEGMMYNDGYYDDGYYDGQIIDGGMAYGGDNSGSYCASCQDQQQQYSQPMMYESEMQPTMSEPAPAPPMEPTPATTDESTPSAFLNHLYSPQPNQPRPIQQVNIPPVEQVLYAPTGPATAR
ncbi:hypothetical protein OAF98_00475 [Planctomicrobium sp.]|jgi:hypothetical protein|nr:hypothetical protein [Planctomicrobium sp.]MBT5017775.1 hypothetical protein [Planctomicrobium sp.]MDB4742932.1 hypothetical protein [Planctomicrobium sp.]